MHIVHSVLTAARHDRDNKVVDYIGDDDGRIEVAAAATIHNQTATTTTRMNREANRGGAVVSSWRSSFNLAVVVRLIIIIARVVLYIMYIVLVGQ